METNVNEITKECVEKYLIDEGDIVVDSSNDFIQMYSTKIKGVDTKVCFKSSCNGKYYESDYAAVLMRSDKFGLGNLSDFELDLLRKLFQKNNMTFNDDIDTIKKLIVDDLNKNLDFNFRKLYEVEYEDQEEII